MSGCKYILEQHTLFLFKAIIVFSDRVTIYSDVISLTADQINTVRVVRRSGRPEVSPTNVSPVTTTGNLWIQNFNWQMN